MQAKIIKAKLDKKGKNPIYKVVLVCPEGRQLYIHFDYSYTTRNYWPLEVYYDGKYKGAKLAWYTNEVENTTVDRFLGKIAGKINKKCGFEF